MEIASLSEGLLKTLTHKGWRFEHPEEMLALFKRIIVDEGNHDVDRLLRRVETELLNMDLRSFGGKSLPDSTAMKKLSQLQGPLILQVVHARDVYQSSIDASLKDPQCHRRLLRLDLTDGHTEAIAIEYSSVPSINEDIVPGTKVVLENKIIVRNGILCLNSKVVKIMGGIVQSLFDEWDMNRKYSGFSRSSQTTDGSGPPPFEKLELEACTSQPRDLHGSRINNLLSMESKTEGGTNMDSATAKEGKVRSSDLRPKEVIEATPVQNQEAAQKLLQKLNPSNLGSRHSRGGRQRGRGREEAMVFTLEEWERSKAGTSKPVGASSSAQDTSHDEELARQLQNQLDMEDFHAEATHVYGAAEQIKLSMFSYGRSEDTIDRGREYEWRGRGSGRRGRGRGW